MAAVGGDIRAVGGAGAPGDGFGAFGSATKLKCPLPSEDMAAIAGAPSRPA